MLKGEARTRQINNKETKPFKQKAPSSENKIIQPLRLMPFCAVGCGVISVVAFFAPEFLSVIFFILVLSLVVAFYKFKTIIVPIIIVLIMLCFSVVSVIRTEKINSLAGQSILVEATVIEEPQPTKYGYSVVVRAECESAFPTATKMLVYYNDFGIVAGNRYKMEVELQTLDEYRTYYYSEGIYACASLKDEPQIIDVDSPVKGIVSVREYIKEALYSNLQPMEAATLNALTVGEKEGFSQEYEAAVRRAGVSHVMVVSGMHLAIIMNAVFFCTQRLLNNKCVRVLTAMAAILAICALCGFTVSVMRAGITFFLMSLAPIFRRESDPINALSFAAVIILILSPFAIFNVSFQLSVLATLGILVLSPSVSALIKYRLSLMGAKFKKSNKLLYKILIKMVWGVLTPCIMTLSATLLTLPVTIWQFGAVSWVALVSNVLISFAVTAALVCALAALIINAIPFCSPVAFPLFLLTGGCTRYINFVITSLGKSERVMLNTGRGSAVIMAVVALVAVVAVTRYKNRVYREEITRIETEEKNNGCFVRK